MHFSILLSRATSYVKGYSIPKTNFAQRIAFALLLRENDKNNRKAKVKARKPLDKSEISALSGPGVKSPIC